MVKRFVAVFIISIIFLSGCERKEEAVPALIEAANGKIDTAVVSRGDIYTLTTYDAKVYPNIQEVCSTIDGTVKEVSVNLGQKVKAGDLLLRLDDTKKKEQLAQLEKQLEDTKVNNEFNDMQQDLDIQILKLKIKQKVEDKASELEIAQMNADLDKLELIREQALDLNNYNLLKMQKKIDDLKEEMEKMVIKAPFSGSVVYLKELHINGWVSTEEPLAIITDESDLHLQSDYIDQSIIKNASMIYAIINGIEYEIEYIPFETDELIKMVSSGITLDSKYSIKADDKIASGDYAYIGIKEKFKTNVITIPKQALYSDSSGNFAYRLTNDKLERCNVEIGTQTDIQVEIYSGLSEGDVVYVQN